MGVKLEETLPYMSYDYMDTIIVHAETCEVAIYDLRVGWYWNHYDRTMFNDYQRWFDDETGEEIRCYRIGDRN